MACSLALAARSMAKKGATAPQAEVELFAQQRIAPLELRIARRRQHHLQPVALVAVQLEHRHILPRRQHKVLLQHLHRVRHLLRPQRQLDQSVVVGRKHRAEDPSIQKPRHRLVNRNRPRGNAQVLLKKIR